MPEFPSYALLTAALNDDVLILLDVHDTTMSPQGTTKQITRNGLLYLVQTTTAISYSAVANDDAIICTATLTVTLPNSVNAGKEYFVKNTGSGTVTIAPASGTIEGVSSISLIQNQGAVCMFDGTNYRVTAGWYPPANNISGILTTLGDTVYEDATPKPVRLPGNTTSTRKFLRQTGTGSVSAAPAWDTLTAGDIPATLNGTTIAGITNTQAIQMSSFSTKTTSYTLALTDFMVYFDVTGGALTATLPDATTCAGYIFIVKVLDASSTGNALHVVPHAGQFIEGTSTSFSINNRMSLQLISDGVGFRLIQAYGTTFFNTLDDGNGDAFTSFYQFAGDGGAFGVCAAEQYQTLLNSYTLTNSTALQKLFNASTNGALTVQANTNYDFECEFDITGLSASAHTIGFSLLGAGTAVFTSLKYKADSNTGAAGTLAAWQSLISTVGTATVISASVTTTTFQAFIRGTFRVNTGGTIIPSVQMNTAAAAAVVSANSWFKAWSKGTGNQTWIGNYS